MYDVWGFGIGIGIGIGIGMKGAKRSNLHVSLIISVHVATMWILL